MSHPIRISLVIPTYNRGPLIAETIDSALAQQHPFAEIIVVDDGSTDSTAEVLSKFGSAITVIRLANGGVQRARNSGVDAATSPWVMFCDSDDLVLPELTRRVAAWLERDPQCDAIYCNFVTFTEHAEHSDKLSQAPTGFLDGAQRSGDIWHDIPDLYLRTVSYQPLFPSGSLIRKSSYLAMGGYDSRFNGVGAEDWEFTLRLVGTARVALCAVPLVRIRKHDGNDSANNLRQTQGCIQILEYALSHHPIAQRYRTAILRNIDVRRADVFAAAFAAGDFSLAIRLLEQFTCQPRDWRFRIKTFVTRLPLPLRTPLWRWVQAR